MTVETNTQNRKVLAQELSHLIGEPYKYMGAPSMAYQIGPYTINRDGSISGDDFEAIHSFLVEHDYIHEFVGTEPEAETEETEETDEAPEREPIDGMSVSIPITELTPIGLSCLLKTLHARQTLIAAMTQSDSIAIDEELVMRLNDEKPDTIERIQELLADEIRAEMVKGVAIEDGKLTMDFPFDESKPTEWQAYAAVMLALADRAKHAHHANAKKLEPTADEMKYFCRNWLLQLGLGGPEHKETRRVLLGHLTGFAAFRTADKMQEHLQRCADRRREKNAARQMQEPEVSTDD